MPQRLRRRFKRGLELLGRKLRDVLQSTECCSERVSAEPASETLPRETRLLLALSRAASAVQRAREPADVFQRICDEIAGLGYGATLFTLTEDECRLEARYLTFSTKLLRAAEKLMGISAAGYSFELLPGSFYERILRKGETVFSDPESGPIADALPKAARPLAGRLARLLGADRAVYAPLTVDGKRYGLMTVMGADLSAADVPAIAAFAGHLSIAIANAQAYQRAQRERFRAQNYLDIAAVILVAIDRDGDITLINRKGCELLGRPEDALLGRNWFATSVPETIREDVKRVFDRLIAGEIEASEYFENPVVTASGEERLIAWRNAPLRDESGDVIGTLSSGQDITDRSRAEDALRESEAKLRSIFRAAPVGMGVVSDRVIVDVNDPFCEMTGYSREELVGKDARVVYASDEEYQYVGREKYGQIENRGTGAVETAFRRKDGTIIDVLLSSTPLDPSDLAAGVTFTALDITEHKRAREALKESEERYRELFEDSAVALFEDDFSSVKEHLNELRANGVVDLQAYFHEHPAEVDVCAKLAQVVSVNQAALVLYGASRKESMLGSVATTLAPETRDAFAQEVLALDKGISPIEKESVYVTATGKALKTLVRISIAPGCEESLKTVHISLVDITERQLAVERLARTLEGAVGALGTATEVRDPYTAGHQKRVTKLALAIADELGLPEHRKHELRLAGLLHDIGKLAVPAEILSKPTQLTETEYALMQAHPATAYEILRQVEFEGDVATIVLQHHEQIDGSGYPAGLRGDEILLEARILCVADVVEAMASHRPYRPALGIDAALEEISTGKSCRFDSAVVEACVTLFREKGFALTD